MNKMTKNIILALSALCIIGVALFAVINWEPASDNEPETTDTASEYIDVTNIDSDAVSSIFITNEQGSYTILSQTENDITTHYIKEYPETEFSQAMLSSAIYSFTGISGKETSADISNKSGYGFDTPFASAVITQNDGSEITVLVGNETAADSGRYVITDASDIVYSVSSYTIDNFLKAPDDYRNREIASIDTSAVKSLTVKSSTDTVMKIRQMNENDNLRTASISNLLIAYPYLRDADADAVTKLLENFTAVSAITFPALNEKDCGFDKGMSIIIENADITHTITFGKTDENGNVYTKYNDLEYIITTSPEMYNTLSALNPINFTSKLIHIFSLDEVKNVAVTTSDKTLNLSVEHGEEADVYTVNGAVSDDETFKSYYQSVIGIELTDICSAPKFDTPYATVVFEFTDGTKDTTTYYNYDDRNYCVKCSDGTTFLVLKKNFDTVLQKIGG